MIVVAVGSMALIIALSVFNGLEDVVKGLHNTFNADLKITPKTGKSFEMTKALKQKIQQVNGILVLTEVIEDNALLKYRDGQMVVTVKGVSDNFTEQTKMGKAMVYGQFKLKDEKQSFAVIGRGVQYILSISLKNEFDALQIWYPRKTKKINLSSSNPEKSFNRKNIFPAGIFSLEQQYDEKYVFVPLEFMQNLLEYGNKRTAIEIKVATLDNLSQIRANLQKKLGNEFEIKTSEEQQASLLKAIQIEKLFVYLTLSFILAVASFNIFFSLMMLVIDKQKDIAILQALGAEKQIIRKIFLLEGVLIAFSGAFVGLTLGATICFLQQKYGLIGMGTTNTVVTTYPVRLEFWDFVYTGITLVIITTISSFIPAIQASKVALKENL